MASQIGHACDNCKFYFTAFHRLRHESMLREEGPSRFFCPACYKEVFIFSDEEKKCPDCKGDQLIGINVTKCPKCQIGNLVQDRDSEVSF